MRTLFIICFLLSFCLPAFAADELSPEWQERHALSKKLHEVKPVTSQINRAIARVAASLPPPQQKPFIASVKNGLNYTALENFSVNTLAELMTKQELEVMLEYYSKPEADAISNKMNDYQQKLGPEIVKMLDRAMMERRTGQ